MLHFSLAKLYNISACVCYVQLFEAHLASALRNLNYLLTYSCKCLSFTKTFLAWLDMNTRTTSTNTVHDYRDYVPGLSFLFSQMPT